MCILKIDLKNENKKNAFCMFSFKCWFIKTYSVMKLLKGGWRILVQKKNP